MIKNHRFYLLYVFSESDLSCEEIVQESDSSCGSFQVDSADISDGRNITPTHQTANQVNEYIYNKSKR